MTHDCECHQQIADSHESCCGYDNGRSPDCPTHGDGSGPRAVFQPISVAQAQAALDGTVRSAVRLLTGLTDSQLDELGAFDGEETR